MIDPDISRILVHTLYTAGCHKLCSIQVGWAAIFALLQRLWDQLSAMLLHMRCHLLCYVSCHRAHSVNCKYTQLDSRSTHRGM